MKRTTSKPHANNEFIRECLDFDDLITKLQELRADHFNADPENIHWGHVGSVGYVNDKLREAINHYLPDTEALYSHMYDANGKRVRICIPGRD